ncbi:MAG TPA: hypothetical protein VGK30_08335, partial [Candidatus Binatia bacterium]
MMQPSVQRLTHRGLLLAALLAAGDAVAATPPPCGPGQWNLTAPPAPIGSFVAGSVVQTLVLGADGTVALPGACPAITAKVTATRKGTVVKAKWPQGTCGGGGGGAARIAATIEPTCTTANGKFTAHDVKATFG